MRCFKAAADQETGVISCRRELVHCPGRRDLTSSIQKLSALDHSAILTCINPKAFWYAGGLEFFRLRAALTAVLELYPIMAGRMWHPPGEDGRACQRAMHFGVSINNAGVLLVEERDKLHSMEDYSLASVADKRGGMSQWGMDAELPPYFEPVNIRKLLEGNEPLLKMKLTHLSDGAAILALTWPHALLDGSSAAMFLNSLAQCYKAITTGNSGAPVTDMAAAAAAAVAKMTAPVFDRHLLSLDSVRDFLDQQEQAPLRRGQPSAPEHPAEKVKGAAVTFNLAPTVFPAEDSAKEMPVEGPADVGTYGGDMPRLPPAVQPHVTLDLAPAPHSASPVPPSASPAPHSASRASVAPQQQDQHQHGTAVGESPAQPGAQSYAIDQCGPQHAELQHDDSAVQQKQLPRVSLTGRLARRQFNLAVTANSAAARAGGSQQSGDEPASPDGPPGGTGGGGSMRRCGSLQDTTRVAQWCANEASSCVDRSPSAQPAEEAVDMLCTAGSGLVTVGHSKAVQQYQAGQQQQQAGVMQGYSRGLSRAVMLSRSSLAIQQMPPASWPQALSLGGQLLRKALREARRHNDGIKRMACEVLHIPAAQVVALKELVAAGRPSISTNDAVAGLFWTTICDLRERPLPGTAPAGAANCMGLAIDLRRNGLVGHLPTNFFGNATWCLHVRSALDGSGEGAAVSGGGATPGQQDSKGSSALRGGGPVRLVAAAGGSGGGMRASSAYLTAVRVAAGKLRGALQDFRSAPRGAEEVLQLASHQLTSKFSSQLQLVFNVFLGQDAGRQTSGRAGHSDSRASFTPTRHGAAR